MREPWPHQVRTDADVRAAYRAGKRAICIVSPTGSGKTYLATRFALGGVSKGSRVLWLAHREELIQQAAECLREEGLRPSIIAPWAPRERNDLQVGSLQTVLARRDMPDADIVVLDEAHHHVSPEWVRIPTHYRERGALILGLTATPQRGDGVALGSVFDAMVVSCQPSELIASGHLVPAHVLRPALQSKALAEHPLQAITDLCQGRTRIIIFASSVHHAKALATEAIALGMTAACVDGAMKREKRREILQSFRAGEIRVLTNMHILTEGFDCRGTDAIILARGFSSEGALMQACGRGMRCAPGKQDLLVIDLRGATLELGLPADDRRFSLEGKGISSDDGLPSIRQCPECGHVFRANEFADHRCPYCGFFFRAKEDPSVRRQRLQDAAASDGFEDRISYLNARVVEALVKGHKIGAAKIKYMLKYTRHGAPKTWPRADQLSVSGYDAAAEVLHELWMYNQVRNASLAFHISGVRSQVEAKALVGLLRSALAHGEASGELNGQRIHVILQAKTHPPSPPMRSAPSRSQWQTT